MSAMRAKFGLLEVVTRGSPADGRNGGKIDAADYAGRRAYVNWYNVIDIRLLRSLSTRPPKARPPALRRGPIQRIPTAGSTPTRPSKAQDASASRRRKMFGGHRLLQAAAGNGVKQAAPGGGRHRRCGGKYETGIEDYKILKSSLPSTATIAGNAYAKCGSNGGL